ncbi:hypothetical protein O6H91_07G135200 [Diphasiastrum complanatum]|uniref:Uncharacterized protein n=1 Tax=Diphasiastrum complanatum TaxID=34168 RepID=A0ACC2DAY8_DIPCM|nr:hypothetical protein O6H91_07G135200 [Diphasiastrum complanatum]
MRSIKAGIVALLIMVAMSSNMGVATAQASCLSVNGASESVADANAAIQALRNTPGQCCQNNCGGFFTLMLTSGNAALTIGGSCGFCLSCTDAGSDLDIALSKCIDGNNQVQAAYRVDGSLKILYVTSVSARPIG